MSTCTPIYGLEYPIGSDRPCDVGDTFCDMMATVDATLTRLDGIVDRVADSVPMAQVRMTIARSQAAGGTSFVPFDTVDVDTDNMVDLTANPYVITLSRFGRYMVYYSVQGATVGVNNIVTAVSSNQLGANSLAFDQYVDDTSTPIYLSSRAQLRYVSTTNAQRLLSIATPGTLTPLTSVTFGIYWLGDLP